MLLHRLPAAVAVLALSACGPPQWSGTYATTGRWDLGGPLFGGRTVGDSATDLVVEQTLSLLGVPSFAEADLTRALDGLVRPGIEGVVDPTRHQNSRQVARCMSRSPPRSPV